MMVKRKLYITAILLFILVLFIQDYKEEQKQTIVPSCFSDADCREPIKTGYCDVDYQCNVGKCYVSDIPCDEDYNNGEDDDFDELIDCDDSDCWDNPNCYCGLASFNVCKAGQCWCPGIIEPKWTVTSGEGYCYCP